MAVAADRTEGDVIIEGVGEDSGESEWWVAGRWPGCVLKIAIPNRKIRLVWSLKSHYTNSNHKIMALSVLYKSIDFIHSGLKSFFVILKLLLLSIGEISGEETPISPWRKIPFFQRSLRSRDPER